MSHKDGGVHAVVDKARTFIETAIVPSVMAVAEEGPVAMANALKPWIAVLDSSRLVSEARSGRVVEGLPVARVLGHLEATGAKAKPVLRSLYGTVGEMGRTHGYDTTVGMFTQLGFVTEPPTDTGARAGSYQVVNSLLQNSVTKECVVMMLRAACDSEPLIVADAITHLAGQSTGPLAPVQGVTAGR